MRGLGSGHVTCGPMRGLEINFTGRGHTYGQTDGHRDSMTESAQWADSVKIALLCLLCFMFYVLCENTDFIIQKHVQ